MSSDDLRSLQELQREIGANTSYINALLDEYEKLNNEIKKITDPKLKSDMDKSLGIILKNISSLASQTVKMLDIFKRLVK